jgi:hypothetical protein
MITYFTKLMNVALSHLSGKPISLDYQYKPHKSKKKEVPIERTFSSPEEELAWLEAHAERLKARYGRLYFKSIYVCEDWLFVDRFLRTGHEAWEECRRNRWRIAELKRQLHNSEVQD